uniref:Uncharacterized protein n=1 Tax=Labrus bergylta TaxID=56723 RepID=A0A3Q3M8J7_9LABR
CIKCAPCRQPYQCCEGSFLRGPQRSSKLPLPRSVLVDSVKVEYEEPNIQQSIDHPEIQDMKPADENGHAGDNRRSIATVFRQAALLGKKNIHLSDLSEESRELFSQELSMCQWFGSDSKCTFISDDEVLNLLINGIRDVILKEIQESPFFSLITDKPVRIADKTHLPVFVRYVGESAPKVELMGFLPFDENRHVDTQAKKLANILTDDWGLPMSQCRGQAFMHLGSGYQSLKKMSLDFLKSYPLSVVTPSESCGLAHWLSGSVPCPSVAEMLAITEDLLLFFEESPHLEGQLAQAVDGLLNMPREALEEIPETCCSRWKKREDFFDILADTFEGILSCLDAVSSSTTGVKSMHAQVLSSALRNIEFIVTLVILKNACAPLRNCSTVFRCGNPADILCEVEKIPSIIETLNKMLKNVSTLHSTWFEQAFQLATKVAPEQVCFSEEANSYESPEIYYRENLSVPLLRSLINEMKYSFSDGHLKALSVLSLLPSCNPQPVLSDILSGLVFRLYKEDLPDHASLHSEMKSWKEKWLGPLAGYLPTTVLDTLKTSQIRSFSNIETLLRLLVILPISFIEYGICLQEIWLQRTVLTMNKNYDIKYKQTPLSLSFRFGMTL